MREVPATEFTRNFGRYREAAQREPIAVTSHGRTTGYFVSAADFEALTRLKQRSEKSFAIADLPESEIEAIASSRMDPRHEHLNRLLDDE